MIFKNKIKKYGIWNLNNSTLLDDVAYYIYCLKISTIIDIETRYNEGCGIKQDIFSTLFKLSPYYQNAKNILRREKLNKLQNKISNDI